MSRMPVETGEIGPGLTFEVTGQYGLQNEYVHVSFRGGQVCTFYIQGHFIQGVPKKSDRVRIEVILEILGQGNKFWYF